MRLLNRFILVIVFLLMSMQVVTAQTSSVSLRADSIIRIIKNSNDPAIIAYNYINIAYLYKKNNPKTEFYLQEALNVALKNNIDSLTGKIYKLLATYYKRKNNTLSKKYLLKALQYPESFSNNTYSNLYTLLGSVYTRLNNYDSALYYYNKAYEIKKEIVKKHPENKEYNNFYGSVLAGLGNLYLIKCDYEKAIDYYNKSLEIYSKTDNLAAQIKVRMNTGLIYMYFNDYDNALKEFKSCYEYSIAYDNIRLRASSLTNIGAVYKATENWDLADSVFREALLIRLETGPETSVAGLYENLGIIAKINRDYKKALNYYKKSLEIKIKRKKPKELAAIYANLGSLYLMQKNYKQAEIHLIKALKYSKESSSLEAMNEILHNLSRLYEKMGNYKLSLKYYKEFNTLDDSIHSLKSEETLNYFKEKFETIQKDKKLMEYRQKEKLSALEKKKQEMANRLLGAGILLVIIVSILILVLINNKRKAEKKIFEKNVELNKQKMLELVKEQEMSSINSFISGQEKERSRIASDLHDRLGSLLSTVKLHFSSLEPYFEKDKEISDNFNYAISLLDKSVSEVRSVSHNLAKEILTEFGLVGSVENLRDAINSAGSMKLVFVNSGFNHRLPYESEIEIYRIIQELVTNAIKHSKANEIIIQFVVTDDVLNITVEDDGIGFDISKIKKNGMGLDNIFKRTAKINGRYSIDSTPGNGSTFIFEIPINPGKNLK